LKHDPTRLASCRDTSRENKSSEKFRNFVLLIVSPHERDVSKLYRCVEQGRCIAAPQYIAKKIIDRRRAHEQIKKLARVLVGPQS
jgi:hypothetical protein